MIHLTNVWARHVASVISLKDYDFIRRYKLAVAAVAGAPRGHTTYRIYVTYAFSDSRTTPHTQYADAVRVSDINQSGLYVKHTMNVETQAIANILCLKDYGMSTEPRTTTPPRPGPAQPRSDPTSTNQPQAPR